MSKASKVTVVQCGTCKKDVEWTAENVYRPFCSKRCQQIDFGDWATESFTIAGEPVLDSEAVMQGYEED